MHVDGRLIIFQEATMKDLEELYELVDKIPKINIDFLVEEWTAVGNRRPFSIDYHLEVWRKYLK
jgi:hypothetical protein